jgi:hypothetical protein
MSVTDTEESVGNVVDFITVCNGVITSVQEGDPEVEFDPVSPWFDHERIILPEGVSSPQVGTPVEYYDTRTWTRKTDEDLVEHGLRKRPKGYKFGKRGQLLKMSDVERVEAGVERLKPGKRIFQGQIIDMNDVEKVQAGLKRIKPDELIEGEIIRKKRRGERVYDNLERMPVGKFIDNQKEIQEMSEIEMYKSGAKKLPERKTISSNGDNLENIQPTEDERDWEKIQADAEGYVNELRKTLEGNNERELSAMIENWSGGGSGIASKFLLHPNLLKYQHDSLLALSRVSKQEGYPYTVEWPLVIDVKNIDLSSMYDEVDEPGLKTMTELCAAAKSSIDETVKLLTDARTREEERIAVMSAPKTKTVEEIEKINAIKACFNGTTKSAQSVVKTAQSVYTALEGGRVILMEERYKEPENHGERDKIIAMCNKDLLKAVYEKDTLPKITSLVNEILKLGDQKSAQKQYPLFQKLFDERRDMLRAALKRFTSLKSCNPLSA